MEWPDGSLIAALVGALGTIGTGVAWVLRRRDSQKDPIPKDAAAVALAQSGVNLMQGVAQRLDSELSDVRGKLAISDRRLSAAEETLTEHERVFGIAFGYIDALLRHIRDGKPPPAPPAPADLRDLIDPELRP
jgi:hypothetical protein